MSDTKQTELKHDDDAANAEALGDAPTRVTVEIGRLNLTVEETLALTPGAIHQLDTPVGSRVKLRAGEKLIAHGELVEHNGSLAVEITEKL